jgi:hypothetical protein
VGLGPVANQRLEAASNLKTGLLPRSSATPDRPDAVSRTLRTPFLYLRYTYYRWDKTTDWWGTATGWQRWWWPGAGMCAKIRPHENCLCPAGATGLSPAFQRREYPIEGFALKKRKIGAVVTGVDIVRNGALTERFGMGGNSRR